MPHRIRLLVALALVVALAAVVASAVGSQSGTQADQVLPGGSMPTVASGPPVLRAGLPPSSALTGHFAVLKRAQTALDSLFRRNGGAMSTEYYDDQAHAAQRVAPLRGVGRPTDSSIYIAGGPDQKVCLLELPPGADGPGGECNSAAVAQQGMAILTQERAAPDADGVGVGGGVDIMGIVPDGVDSVTVKLGNGDTSTLPVSGNLYSANMPSATSSVTFTDQSGTHTIDAPSG